MKPKKNPKKDLNKNRGLYFVSGLALIMMLAYVALEWKSYDLEICYDCIGMNEPDILEEEIPPIIQIKLPPPPQPPPVAPTHLEVEENDADIEETVIESTETNQDVAILEVDDVEVAEIDEPDEVPFMVIEDVPIFPGCEQEKEKGSKAMRDCFQKMINKHIGKVFRYPKIAQEMGVEGKVYTQFTIQKDGSIGNVKMRGPDKNLEKEAARIIDKLPKMTPGKQRGKSVSVPFSIPITFKLQ